MAEFTDWAKLFVNLSTLGEVRDLNRRLAGDRETAERESILLGFQVDRLAFASDSLHRMQVLSVVAAYIASHCRQQQLLPVVSADTKIKLIDVQERMNSLLDKAFTEPNLSRLRAQADDIFCRTAQGLPAEVRAIEAQIANLQRVTGEKSVSGTELSKNGLRETLAPRIKSIRDLATELQSWIKHEHDQILGVHCEEWSNIISMAVHKNELTAGALSASIAKLEKLSASLDAPEPAREPSTTVSEPERRVDIFLLFFLAAIVIGILVAGNWGGRPSSPAPDVTVQALGHEKNSKGRNKPGLPRIVGSRVHAGKAGVGPSGM